jgi:hypothetical protein
MNNNNIYSFYYSFKGNRNVPSWVVYTFVAYFIIAGIVYLATLSMNGFFLFLSYPLLFYFFKQHLQIDFKNKMYRLGTDAFGYTMGKWDVLPNIEYISVFAGNYSVRSQNRDYYDTFEKIEINLIYSSNKKLNVWIGDDKDKAIAAAKFIAQNLNLRVLDATQREFEWLDE